VAEVLVMGSRGLALGALLGVLTGCVSHGGLTRDTMAACINEAGITGSYSASSVLRNDQMTFVVRAGPNVTGAQADIANACIARTIAGGQPGVPATASPVAALPKSSRPASATGSSCSRGGGLLQGGTGYCSR
jgi:hypothetical protein